ncbi:MAG: Cys/Met metabolism pyridoxal-phosphate-dependent protein [Candidatus Uhrbacteria bacterium GW2011_GWA2_52_8d]|uniref:Cys/Met metabolism pyridoxal-phosphate-dependent protein n=1 Tax=Candidatus Uhrbacteria bacterium GW2011_GWA2_52_8d TaxID=1618979 RepID=A0A0G1XMB4_9BACT|nr:MAG: Cys/Met metabolism pyridoxal-phosphate-dependent protein [Candidatus Uhrbacteria bacterium GW2011_GWA2_52_8d]
MMSTYIDDAGMSMSGGQAQVNNTTALTAYNPYDHDGAVAVPNVTAATFGFRRAEDGEHSFGCAYAIEEVLARLDPDGTRHMKDIYARLTCPAVRACEASMKALEPGADWAFVFPSGMGAITALVQVCCHHSIDGSPVRDVVIHSSPLYGGTHALLHTFIQRWGFTHVEVNFRDPKELRDALESYGDRVGLVFCETPANPTLDMVDIRMVREIMDEVFDGRRRPPLGVDNTFMGIFQHTLLMGADVAVYSATKFLSGHSDLIAGFLVGKTGIMTVVKPFTGDAVEASLMNAVPIWQTGSPRTPRSPKSASRRCSRVRPRRSTCASVRDPAP